jgi:hypothetical protein
VRGRDFFLSEGDAQRASPISIRPRLCSINAPLSDSYENCWPFEAVRIRGRTALSLERTLPRFNRRQSAL